MRSRIHRARSSSERVSPANAVMACTTSGSVASSSLPFNPRKMTAVRKAMWTYPENVDAYLKGTTRTSMRILAFNTRVAVIDQIPPSTTRPAPR